MGKDKIEFISYDGSYPNLCSGKLAIKVNGKRISFPEGSLSSGGSVTHDGSYNNWSIENGPWSINEWPDEIQDDIKYEITELVNSNVEWGCCGGCI